MTLPARSIHSRGSPAFPHGSCYMRTLSAHPLLPSKLVVRACSRAPGVLWQHWPFNRHVLADLRSESPASLTLRHHPTRWGMPRMSITVQPYDAGVTLVLRLNWEGREYWHDICRRYRGRTGFRLPHHLIQHFAYQELATEWEEHLAGGTTQKRVPPGALP